MDPQAFETLLSEVCDYKYSTEVGGLVVKKLFKSQTPCYYGGLGKGCHIESRKHKEIAPLRQASHWRHKCSHCGAYINAKTGERAFLKATNGPELRQFYDCVESKD